MKGSAGPGRGKETIVLVNPIGVDDPRAGADANSLDRVARGLADGRISRGRALRIGAAALVGSTLALPTFASPAEARRSDRCRRKKVISNRKCPTLQENDLCASQQGGTRACVCAKKARSNDVVCVNLTDEECPTRDECDGDGDCRGNEVCIEVGACCDSPKNLCVKLCA